MKQIYQMGVFKKHIILRDLHIQRLWSKRKLVYFVKMCSHPKQQKLDVFFKSTQSVSSKTIVKQILESVLLNATTTVKKSHISANDATIKGWKKAYPWLNVETVLGEARMKCSICVKFKTNSVWANDGAINIQRSALERHNISKDHIDAQTKDLKTSSSTFSDIESENDDIKDIDKSDIFLFRTVYSLMKNEVPLNQLDAILELQRLNGVEMPYRNLSWTTVKEITDIISKQYKMDLINKINSSNFFALLLDESTDISVSKRLSICVRYVKDGQAVTSFLASCEIPDGGAYTIVESVYKVVHLLGLDLTKCVSLATDGASVMMGRKAGVGVQLKSKFCPFLTQTHCIAHRLNLAITDAVKKNDAMKKFKEMFQSLYNFMSASTIRINTLKSMQDILNEPEISIKEPHSIRWLGLKKAVEVVYECYGSLLAAMSHMASDNPTAKGLYKYFSTYKTALMIGFMYDIHTELGVLSCNLQQQSLIFSDAFPLIEGTIGKLDYMKVNDGNGLIEMKKSIDMSDSSQPSYKGEPLKYYKESTDSEFKTVKLEYLNSLTNNIKKRIRKDDSEVLSSLGLMLEPQSFSQDHENAYQCISNLYCEDKVTKMTVDDVIHETAVAPLINKDELNKEWPGVKAIITGSYRHLSLQEFCKKILIKHKNLYPNFARLAEIGLCIELTSVECERSFSVQNRLKTKYRAALKEESLEALLTVRLLGPPVAEHQPAKAVREWNKIKKRRKKRLTRPYKPRYTDISSKKC